MIRRDEPIVVVATIDLFAMILIGMTYNLLFDANVSLLYLNNTIQTATDTTVLPCMWRRSIAGCNRC